MYVKVLAVHKIPDLSGLRYNLGVHENVVARVVDTRGVISVVRLNDYFVNAGDEINIVKSEEDDSFNIKDNYTQDLIVKNYVQEHKSR